MSGLTFKTTHGDSIEITNGTRDWWVNNCNFMQWDDGALDIVRAPSGGSAIGGTVSRCTFAGGDKAMLIGNDDDRVLDILLHVTIDHCLFTHFGRRAPYVRFATVHMRDTLIQNWGQVGQDEATAISLRRDARMLMERVTMTGGPKAGKAVTVKGGAMFASVDSHGHDQPNVGVVGYPPYHERY